MHCGQDTCASTAYIHPLDTIAVAAAFTAFNLVDGKHSPAVFVM